MVDNSICPICKNPKKTSGSGSLTQWIVSCTCEISAESDDSDINVNICRNCGKRIGEGRSGSFTQFIFRADLCPCETPKPKIVKASSIQVEPPVSATSEIYELDEVDENLKIDKDNFPTERYKPLRQLGTGGAGNVYLARDMLLNKLVAVKVLISLEKKQLIAFQSEAKAMSKLQHPNIVGLLDFGIIDSSVPYMVLEYVPGIPLEKVFQKEQQLHWSFVLDIFDQLCNGLIYAHEHGILHRDIKPSNLILVSKNDSSERQEVKIIDFGIAQVLNPEKSEDISSTTNAAIVGAPLYMSPDQGLGLNYNASSEVYSIGCVLFEAITGSPPFVGETPLQTLNMHVESEIPKPSNFVEELPPLLDKIISKALAKNRSERYETISLLHAQLELVENQETYKPSDNSIHPKSKFQLIGRIIIPILSILIIVSIGFFLIQKQPISTSKNLPKNPKSVIEPNPDNQDPHLKDKTLFESIPMDQIDKELGWTGGKWVFKTSKSGVREARGHDVTDDDFKDLKDKGEFQSFTLTMEAKATGSGFKYLVGRKIKKLWSMSNFFNDDGASYLTEFPDITSVKLWTASDLTPTGFRSIAKLPNLKELQMRQMFMLRPGTMKAIATSPSLESITLEGVSPFSKQDLLELKKIPTLHTLRLNGVTGVDDSFVPIIVKMKLKRLDIGMSKISDQGLMEISKIDRLKTIGLTVTDNESIEVMKRKSTYNKADGISLRGLNKFKKLKPNCKVKRIKNVTRIGIY